MTGPYSTYPGNPKLVAERIVTKLNAVKLTVHPTLDIATVYYGDQDRFPATPSVCVEPGDKNRTLQGAPNMTQNDFEMFILVYHNKVQGNQNTRKEVDDLAYSIEQFMHQDLQLTNGNPSDPYMIHGFVATSESGYAFKAGTLYRVVRLTWRGRNKTSLPTA
jgi:hypothetical protein